MTAIIGYGCLALASLGVLYMAGVGLVLWLRDDPPYPEPPYGVTPADGVEMRTVVVLVRQSHIDTAAVGYLAIRCALYDAGHPCAYVGPWWICQHGAGYGVRTPPEVQQFLQAFDRGQRPAPFTFQIDLPVEVRP